MKTASLSRFFINSAAVLLVAMSVAFLLSNLASGTLVQPHDPIMMISVRIWFWILGTTGLAVSLICIFVNNPRLKMMLVLWLSLNLVVYGLGLLWVGAYGLQGYLGALANTFGLSTGTTDTIVKTLVVYLLAGSFVLLLWSWLQKFQAETEIAFFKIACAHCGGHIKFAPQNVGQNIPCPHCQKTLTLHKPENLKMSCFFCKEHIEFPVHALGRKISCPHCKMDITLKEPA